MAAIEIERREVTLGLTSATDIEVLSGLAESERVVFGEQSQFKPGELVKPKFVTPSEVGIGSRCHPFPYDILISSSSFVLFVCVLGLTSLVANARGYVSAHQYSRGDGGDILQRHAAAADRSGYHGHVRAIFHAGQRNRPHGIALDVRREPDQGLFPAGNGRERGRHSDFQSRDGGLAAASAGDAAARRDEHGCVELARLPAYGGGPGAERNSASRLPAISDSKSDRGRARSDRASAVRGPHSPDHGLRGPAEAAGAPTEPDGRGARDGRCRT